MYNIIFSNKADKELNALKKKDKKNFGIIIKHLQNLTLNPQFYGKPLKSNLAGLWSYRIGDFRVIYQIQEDKLLILVINIGHRKNVYEI